MIDGNRQKEREIESRRFGVDQRPTKHSIDDSAASPLVAAV